MNDAKWMIYGATGYTGQLVAEEAVRHGHAPILAGRNEEKLRALGKRLGLKYMAFGLDDVKRIAEAIANVDLVYHSAGPFTHTSNAMIRACLATHTHYVDITGEIGVLENTLAYDEAARKIGIALIGGVGFDVIPTDCLARHVAERLPGATQLEIGIMALADLSAGTVQSMMETIPHGVLVRRSGKLQSQSFGAGARQVQTPLGERWAMPIPWGDVATAYRSTGIPNISTYMVWPRPMILATRLSSPLLRGFLSIPPLRRAAQSLAGRLLHGPSAAAREANRAYAWARASDAHGGSVEAWIETAEGYQFTALAAIPVVERVLADRPSGAITPSLAWGADFVLEIEGSRRFELG